MPRQTSLAIVGADFPNQRGPGRRFEIAMCEPGELVELRHDPKNPADERAIAVFSARGIQIGYVRAERAQFVGTVLHRGFGQAIFQRKEPWGCTIRVSLDGSVPTLPAPTEMKDGDWPPPGSEDPDWWPDEIWPD